MKAAPKIKNLKFVEIVSDLQHKKISQLSTKAYNPLYTSTTVKMEHEIDKRIIMIQWFYQSACSVSDKYAL